MMGTNPIVFGMPSTDPFPFVLDCATSVNQRGKIEKYAREGKPTPAGAVLSKDGVEMTDSKAILQAFIERTARCGNGTQHFALAVPNKNRALTMATVAATAANAAGVMEAAEADAEEALAAEEHDDDARHGHGGRAGTERRGRVEAELLEERV